VTLVAQYLLFALINNGVEVAAGDGLAGVPAIDDVVGR
jgi:hypothetical protein